MRFLASGYGSAQDRTHPPPYISVEYVVQRSSTHTWTEAQKKDTDEESAAIWDHAWNVSLGGRLMDEKQRRKCSEMPRPLGGL